MPQYSLQDVQFYLPLFMRQIFQPSLKQLQKFKKHLRNERWQTTLLWRQDIMQVKIFPHFTMFQFLFIQHAFLLSRVFSSK